MTPTVQGPGGASEHYAMHHMRDVRDAIAQLFHHESKPFIRHFVETEVNPILWRLINECEEKGREMERRMREYDKGAV